MSIFPCSAERADSRRRVCAQGSALSAEQGKILKRIIDDGIFGYADFKEIPVAVTFVNKYYCDRQTGQKTSVNNTATNFSEAEINGADFVAFNGISVAMGGSSSYGYCFGYYATPNDASSWVTVNTGNWDVEGNENKLKRYFIKVPEGATHFRTTSSCYSLLTADNFFLSLIYGKNLEDELWGLYGYGDWVDYAQIDVTEKKRVNTNGSLGSNNNYDVWSVDVEGEAFVRFSRMQTADTPTFGYSFYDSSNVAIMPTQYVGNGVAQRLGDDILKVPENAKYFKFSVRRESTIGSVYVKKFMPQETTISERLNDVEAKMEITETGNPNEIEMPLVGLTLSDNKVATDSIYTPEQFNFGGFKAVLPDNIGITWYRGDNPDNFGAGDSIEVYNGDIVKFPKKYSYYNIFRLHFHLIGEGTISVDMIKEHIANGEIKILYTPNDNHTSITQRQSHCEQYLRALQGRLVTNYGDTTRKCYGTHDLPMFVHCSDIHNDIVRLSSAIEYGKYIQADAVVLTGDYPMRGATNGIGYVKDLDEKWNPTTEDATQIMPILVGTGNHDPWHVTLEAMRADIIEPFVEKYNYRKDASNLISGRAYYYVDLNVPAPRDGGYVNGSSTYNHTQLVRIIMLDLVDEQAGEISRWGISQAQIEWFIDTLNSTPSGAAILIGMHTSPDFMEAPSVRAAKYQQESPQVRELKYATDMFTYKGFLANDSEFLNGSYNFLADSMRMQNVGVTASTNLFNKINITGNLNFDPYAINEKGQRINKFNVVATGVPLRLTNASLSASFSLNGKGSINGNDGRTQGGSSSGDANSYQRIYYHPVTGEYIPGGYVYYMNPSSPWSINVSYQFNYSKTYTYQAATQELVTNRKFTQTMSLSGNVKLTPRLSIQASTGFDFMAMKLTSTQISASYDLHCFNIAVSWVPMGMYKSYSFRIAANAAALADLLRFKKSESYMDNILGK